MKLLVIGATGRTGRDIVNAALEAHHHVVAFARSAGKVNWPEGATPFPGDVLDATAVEEAMQGVDAVIVALSMVRRSDFPWAKILTPLDLHARAADVLIAAAQRHGVRRYVAISAHGVGDSRPRAGTLFLALVHSSNIGVAYRNLAVAEDKLRASDLDWTLVRPTRLTNEPATGAYTASPDLVTTSRDHVSRQEVARFLVREATSPQHLRQAVSLTSA